MVRGKAAEKQAGGAEKQAAPTLSNWRDLTVSTDEAGEIIKKSGERVRQLTKAGFIRKAGRDQYRIGDVLDGYLAYQEDALRRAAADTPATKLAASRRREIELRIARDEGRVVDIEDVQAFVVELFGGVVAEFRGLAAASTRDLAVRKTIEEQLNGTFARCQKRIDQLGADMRAGKGIVLADDGADA